MITSEKTFRHVGGLTWDRVDERVVVLDADGSSMITLNPIGSILWPALESDSTCHGLAETLARRFDDVPIDRLRADVDDFLGELLDAGLIEVVDPEPDPRG